MPHKGMIKVRFSYLASKKRGKKFNNWSENKKRMSGKHHSLPGHSLIDYNVSITIPCSVRFGLIEISLVGIANR